MCTVNHACHQSSHYYVDFVLFLISESMCFGQQYLIQSRRMHSNIGFCMKRKERLLIRIKVNKSFSVIKVEEKKWSSIGFFFLYEECTLRNNDTMNTVTYV